MILSNIERLNSSLENLTQTANDIAKSPETSGNWKEFLEFTIDQLYLNNQELINSIISSRTANQLGLAAKKATVSATDFLTTANLAMEEFPDGDKELKEALLEQSLARSKLDAKLEKFWR